MRSALSLYPFHPIRALLRGQGRRAWGAALGIVLLMLQLVVPVMGSAAAGGDWIEICSEFGAVEIQMPPAGTVSGAVPGVEPGDGSSNTPECPDCATCALCALVTVAIDREAQTTRLDARALPAGRSPAEVAARNPAQFWPDSRGPPPGPAIPTARAPRAALASIADTGEPPWN